MRDMLRHDVVPLLLRLGFGGLLLGVHGLPKALNFPELIDTFPDPLGIGSPLISLLLTLFAEVLCAAAVVFGVLTRITAIPPLVTMVVAAFVVHAPDPFAKKELALCFAIGFLCLVLGGGGRLAVDTLRRRA
jgi:putative oxidoreductase